MNDYTYIYIYIYILVIIYNNEYEMYIIIYYINFFIID
jgi:hypothetical protein